MCNEQRHDDANNFEDRENANGKFLKGPDYWKPEPKIKALLEKAASR